MVCAFSADVLIVASSIYGLERTVWGAVGSRKVPMCNEEQLVEGRFLLSCDVTVFAAASFTIFFFQYFIFLFLIYSSSVEILVL